MIKLSEHPEGVLLPVRDQPGASKNGIRGEQDGALKVAVTQIAEKGKANAALIDALAKGLNLKRSQIELVSGETQRAKQFLIRGVALTDLAARIAAALAKE
jgi:uncharacterized protein (TIGR00251 family)